jgi:hypothetical protein
MITLATLAPNTDAWRRLVMFMRFKAGGDRLGLHSGDRLI